ncbi:MAG: hypothetical protein AAB352_02035 [Patescibacteria group bacterium]
MISKEQFLIEHNKLSPLSLQATLILLTQFKEAKRPLLEDNSWSIDKLRMPFISWLLSLPKVKKNGRKNRRGKQTFKNYPETKL